MADRDDYRPVKQQPLSETSPLKGLRARYLIAFGLIATLSVVAFLGLGYLVLQSEKWTSTLSGAELQRMVSQRIAKAAERDSRGEIAREVVVFERMQHAIRYGDPALGVQGLTGSAFEPLFIELNGTYSELTKTARAIAETPGDEAVADGLLESLREQERAYLTGMNNLILQIRSTTRAEFKRLELLHLVVLALTLATLVFELAFVFEPAARRIKLQWQKLQESEQRFNLAVRGSQNAIWDWDLTSGKFYYSPMWAILLHDERLLDETTPDAWFRLVTSNELNKLNDQLEQLKTGVTDVMSTEIEMCTPCGDRVSVLCRGTSVRDASGEVVRLAGSLADITEQRRVREKLREMAEQDALTGLVNRGYFQERIELQVLRTRRDAQGTYAVLFFDFDGFKAVNDALGHNVGDELLISIARRLEEMTPTPGVVSRLGGDEFAVLVPGIGPEDATRLAGRLVERFREPHKLGTHEVVSTSSIGLVIGDQEYTDADALLRDADTAMYAAKVGGKSQYCVFDESMRRDSMRRLRIETGLLNADFDKELSLAFQPIVDLESGARERVEVLLRWPGFGEEPVRPDVFIPIAEETGVIIELGEWVLIEAAKRLQEWDARLGHTRTSVHINISRRQLLHPRFVEQLESLRTRHPGVYERLVLEVPEAAIMDRRSNPIDRLREIREAGYKLTLDNFGTGHSSLSCLHQFSLHAIKIDRSFVMEIEHRREFAALYHAIVTLSQNLGLTTIAMGVETRGQLGQLQGIGCSLGQGYLFARPMDAENTLRFLAGETEMFEAA